MTSRSPDSTNAELSVSNSTLDSFMTTTSTSLPFIVLELDCTAPWPWVHIDELATILFVICKLAFAQESGPDQPGGNAANSGHSSDECGFAHPRLRYCDRPNTHCAVIT